MGLLFCYSIFGRRAKIGRTVPDLGSKTGLRAIKKAELEERRDSAGRDLELLKGMDEYKMVDALLKGDELPQGAVSEHGIECDLLDSSSKEQLGFERDVDSSEKLGVPEFVVDVEKITSHQVLQQPPYRDLVKSCCGTPMWSSCSQGTFQGEVSLSVGEGTLSSDGQRPVLPHQDATLIGGSLGAHEDSSSESSFGGRSNISSHAQGSHDGESARCAGLSRGFPFGTRYSDGGIPEVVVDLKSEVVAEGEVCLDVTRALGAPICDDEERYSGHASDPGLYASEIQKVSPDACLDGSMSPPTGANECPVHFTSVEKLSGEADDEMVGTMPQAPNLSQVIPIDEVNSSFTRVKEWINSIQSSDLDFGIENEDLDEAGRANFSVDMPYVESSEALTALHPIDTASANSLANAAVRSLHPSSTVAHLSGIGLWEVPSLGIFSSLRTLNLSANLIVHVPAGCLPRSLHSLDLSRNRIAQIEGFRELTRLRVLNLSHNRISRIGHGLANCTLIKELYLAGNKIGEVEGLHRLLKLAVLDLSFNKVTTSKALGQLAANYGSLLALNLLGNPILTNFSEDQMRKLVTALTPHVAYLNRQPIKAISVREAALDSVARAALGTSQRHSKSRDIKPARKPSAALPSTAKKKPPPHQHTRLLEKKVAAASSSGHHHHHGKVLGRTQGGGQSSFLGGPFQYNAFDSGKQPMPRSRSTGVLQE
ncbi:hypothetical protein L7F22_004352 [Adiantum nelumboides]|nr:hypothetical protein [Adiantum nelumboides]